MTTAVRRPWAILPGREPWAELDIGPNRVAILKDGRQAYPAMLAAIGGARSSICFETYIFRDDTTGLRFAEALMERARAGLEVLFMYDHWGSSITEELRARLMTSGVKVLAFRPLDFTRSLGRVLVALLRRNHRKSLIVDGEVGFTGGLNISDEYAAVEDHGKGWRDTHVRLVGPAAGDLERLFLETWQRNRGTAVRRERFPRRPQAFSRAVRIVGNDFAEHRKDIRKAYLSAIGSARERISLTHAYFLPPRRVVKALVRAAKRGVKVAVILAAATDMKVVLYAARGLYPSLLRANIAVYEWHGRVLHAKTAAVDDRWATVGSSNLDPLSLRQNLEVNAVFEDSTMARALHRMFKEDLDFCTRIDVETVRGWSLVHRLFQWIAYRLRHWL